LRKIEERTVSEFIGNCPETREVRYVELSTDGHRYSQKIMELNN